MNELIAFRASKDIANFIKNKAAEEKCTKTEVIIKVIESSLKFLELKERDKLPEVAGVYFVYSKNPNKLLYIGKSSNLKLRWLSHHRLYQFTNYDTKIYLSWFECSEEEIHELEREYISECEPELNNTVVIRNSSGITVKEKVEEKESRLSLRLSDRRMEKLRQYAEKKDTTITHLVEQWVDSLILNAQ